MFFREISQRNLIHSFIEFNLNRQIKNLILAQLEFKQKDMNELDSNKFLKI